MLRILFMPYMMYGEMMVYGNLISHLMKLVFLIK